MRRLLVVLLSASALVAAAAHAQGAAPAPGCAGLAFTDRTGDVSAFAGPTARNLDIVAGWFNTDPAGKVTANLQVADMDLMPAPPATAATWYTVWTVGSTVYYVALEADVTGATVYDWGTYVQNEAAGTATYTPSGETTGSVTEGPDGVVSIVVPKGAKGTPGQKFSLPNGQTSPLIQNTQGGGVLLPGDRTSPDEGRTYDVGACEFGGGSSDSAPDAPAPGQPGAPSGSEPARPTAAPKVPLTLRTKTVRAKKGRLAVKFKASEDVTQIGARVRKGKKVFGTGRLAKLAKGKTGTVGIKAKKAKRGTYVLDVTARLADGTLSSGSFKLKVK